MRIVHTTTIVPDRPAGLRPFWRAAAPATHVVLRIGAALLFIQHGVQKLFGWLGGFGGDPGATAPLVSLMGLAGVLEVGGGLLILAGLLTRPVALLLTGQMIIAYIIAHMPQGGYPIENQGELALLYALVFTFLVGNGAGRLSIDYWLASRHKQPAPAAPPPAERERRTATAERRRDTAA